MNSSRDDRKQRGAHYTAPALAGVLAERLIDCVRRPFEASARPLRILDPACGDGALLEALHERLPAALGDHVQFEGFDTHPEAVETARDRLESRNATIGRLRETDFLEWSRQFAPHRQFSLLDDDTDSSTRPDWIIANPPYVRTQVLGSARARAIADVFDLSGRIDLYQAFLVGMIATLPEGGALAALVPNRVMSTRGAADLRDYVRRHLDLETLIDLGDTKRFDAGVLPAIVGGRKSSEASDEHVVSGHFVRMYERQSTGDPETDEKRVTSTSELLSLTSSGTYALDDRTFDVRAGRLRTIEASHAPWAIVTKEESDWLDRLRQTSAHTFGELCDIHVGLKTNADDVFIRDDWDELLPRLQPEPELLHPLLSSRRASRWSPNPDDGRRVLYPHRTNETGERIPIDLEAHPRARAYLEQHRDRLASREYLAEAGRRWYEHWVPHQPRAWEEPKVVFPDISDEPIFFWDDDGRLVDGNCYWMTLRRHRDDLDLLYLLLGLANSELMARYHDLCFQNRLYAGRRRYITQYVENYPVPDPRSDEAEAIAELTRQLVETAHRGESHDTLEDELEAAVDRAFDL